MYTFLYDMIQGLSPSKARDVSLIHNIQTSSGFHSASYSMGTSVLSWG